MADEEITRFEDGDVVIADDAVTIASNRYPLAGIRSVELTRKDASVLAPALMILGGFLFIPSTVARILDGQLLQAVLFILVVAGLIGTGVATIKRDARRFDVRIVDASGPRTILESDDTERLQRIVDAVQQAIMERSRTVERPDS